MESFTLKFPTKSIQSCTEKLATWQDNSEKCQEYISERKHVEGEKMQHECQTTVNEKFNEENMNIPE
jgi:hypothetical protein